MTKKILIINGPNLNLLGEREESKYGKITLKEVEKSLKSRDYSDKNRKESPLLFVKGAVLVDTTNLTINQMKSKIVKLVRSTIKQKIDGNI